MKIFRIAPSPTGYVHLGTAKSWIINFALAKSYNGIHILRIEDTDNKRNRLDLVDSLIKDINWLGINYDKGPEIGKKNEYFQSERFDIYKKYIQQLLDEGKAYKAYETPEERALQIAEQRKKGSSTVYSGDHANLTQEQQAKFEAEGRKPVVRLKVPKNKIIEFNDKVFGKVTVNTNTIGDIVIQKSDGSPMYNFCVVIDDHLMEVTDVVRGFGHLSNTPKQILIYEMFGWKIPTFAHFSDILNENAPGKLSKRFGAKPVARYRAEGYLPDAIFNYITIISCSFSFSNKDEEIMKQNEIYEKISYDKILKSNAKFGTQKLDWINGQHIRRLPKDIYIEKIISWLENDIKDLKTFDETFDDSLVETFISDKSMLTKILPLVQERITKFTEIFPYLRFFFIEPNYKNIDISPCKKEKEEFDNTVKELYNLVINLTNPFEQTNWENSIRALGDKINWKHGDLFMALRLIIVGDRFSPPLFESMEILGKETCLQRIDNYLKTAI